MSKLKIYKWLKEYFADKHNLEYTKIHFTNSACPRCKVWVSDGNRITNEYHCEYSDKQTCHNCNHKWYAMFTADGFVHVEDCKE